MRASGSQVRGRGGGRAGRGPPVQRGHAVLRAQAAACGHHVEAVGAVALHMQVGLGVPVLHHHDEARPAVRQVVAGHALASLAIDRAGMGWGGGSFPVPLPRDPAGRPPRAARPGSR